MSATDGGYVALVKNRDVAPLLFWVSIARLMYGVLPLSLLLLLSQARHSYADAGAALAAYGLTAGLLGPARARLCDRRGAHRVVPGLGLGLLLAIAAMTQVSRAPLMVVVGLALVAGSMAAPVGPLMRVAWRQTCGHDADMVRRAYSLDAVGEEVLYIGGPLLAAVSVAWLGTTATAIASAIVFVVAAWGIGAAVRTVDLAGVGPNAEKTSRSLALWRNQRFLVGLTPMVGLGFLLGGLDVAAVAAALADSTSAAAAGLPAAALSAGSVVGGLLYGRRSWPGSPSQRATVLACTAAVIAVVVGLTLSAFTLMVALLVGVGVCVAPAIVCSYLGADEAAPPQTSEGGAWVNAAFNAALALGMATGGILVEAGTPSTAVLVLAGITCAVLLLPGAVRPS